MIPERIVLENLVRRVAQEEILPRFTKISYSLKDDGSLLTEADLATDQRLQRRLAELYPDIAFLSEEMALKNQEKLLSTSDRLWCLDPLDGTSNFAAGIPLFACSLALFEYGKVVMGFTYDPIRDEMFTAELGQGAWLNGERLFCLKSTFALQNAVAMVDFKRLTPQLRYALLNHPPFSSQRNLGSCVLEWAWMAANRGHVYLHGGMKLWDLAVGTLLVSEAGGYASTLTGESVFRAKMQPRSVIISPDKQLFDAWRQFLNENG